MGAPVDPIQVLRAGGRLIVRLPFTPERVEKMRTLPGRRWHAAERYWSLEDSPGMPAALLDLFAGDAVELAEGLAPPLEERVRAAAIRKGLSPGTAASYGAWARRFLAAAGGPRADRVEPYLAGLAGLSASTYNQALHALGFLFKEVLGAPLPALRRAKMPLRAPAVLSRDEAGRLLATMSGPTRLMAGLLYGSGLRLGECCGLQVQDFDWNAHRILVGGRETPIPGSLDDALRRHLAGARRLRLKDAEAGCGGLPWAFPAPGRYYDARARQWRRHHVHETVLQRAVREARLRAGIVKPASCRTLRQSFAAHMLEDGYDARTVQELLGHRSVESTLAYDRTAVRGVRSPLQWDGGL